MGKDNIYEKLKGVLEEKVALGVAEAIFEAVESSERKILEGELNFIKDAMREILKLHKENENKISELTQAQKDSAKSLDSFKKLTEENFNKVWRSINELTEAQKKTEERVNELAEAQKKTEERLTRLEIAVENLAEAQKRTEENINKLTLTVEDLKTQVGGHSHTIGHILEDKAISKLPKILRKRFNFEIEVPLKRGYLENNKGIKEEVNIFGFAKKNGEKYLLLGEGKTRFSKKDLEDFQEKIKRFEKKYKNIFPFIVTYILSSPEMEEEIKEKGIQCFFSFEFEK